MGKAEEKIKRRAAKANLQKIVLGAVATAGILSVAMLAPNSLGVLKSLDFVQGRRIESIKAARKRLVAAGLLSYEAGFLKLTPKGESKLRQLELHNYQIKKPKRWDGKWRVLIFDIAEKRKGLRDKVRLTLVAIGFEKIQDSVWAYPYDCEDLIALLKTDFKVGKELLYLIVDSIENDNNLRDKFGLHLE